jgi:hypothetical protein
LKIRSADFCITLAKSPSKTSGRGFLFVQSSLHFVGLGLIYQRGLTGQQLKLGVLRMADMEKYEKRATERRLIKTEVTFKTKDDIYRAKSVDMSDNGIRIITEKPVDIRIQIKEEDKQVQYEAQLVWARVKDDGTMEYGLKC